MTVQKLKRKLGVYLALDLVSPQAPQEIQGLADANPHDELLRHDFHITFQECSSISVSVTEMRTHSNEFLLSLVPCQVSQDTTCVLSRPAGLTAALFFSNRTTIRA